MSRHKHKGDWEPSEVPAADREAFLRENAPAVVAEKDERIRRLRRELSRAVRQVQNLRIELGKANAGTRALAAERDRLAAEVEALKRALEG